MAETSTFALDHVSQRLQGALVRTSHCFPATTVIQQRVNGLLQHTLFVADDNFWCFKFEQTLQTVVAVDNATVEVIQIGGCEAAAIQRHQRTQVRGQYWQHFENHPVRLDAGFLEAFKNLQTLGKLLVLGFGTGDFEFGVQRLNFGWQIQIAQQFTNALGTHKSNKLVTMLFHHVQILLFSEQLGPLKATHHTRIGNNIGFKIEHALNISQRHVQHHTETGWQGFQEPNMSCR